MKKIFLILVFLVSGFAAAQDNPFKQLDFLIGHWQGTGSGFGNETSVIRSEFNRIMNNTFIEVKNDSKFKPTDNNPEGEHHTDWGMLSFDKSRKKIIFRQFNNEGFVNQYILVDSLSNDTTLVFLTESIENFMPGGKARWIINRKSENTIETLFDVSFPGKEYTCFGTNQLSKK